MRILEMAAAFRARPPGAALKDSVDLCAIFKQNEPAPPKAAARSLNQDEKRIGEKNNDVGGSLCSAASICDDADTVSGRAGRVLIPGPWSRLIPEGRSTDRQCAH